MEKLKIVFDPFRYIAGLKALLLGLVFILSAALLLNAAGYLSDGYLHYTVQPEGVGFLRTLALQLLAWLIPALMLYLAGLVFSKSKIRIIDVLGTTAFAQLLQLFLIVPMLVPALSEQLNAISESVLAGTMPTVGAWIIVYGIWAMLWLVFFLIFTYKAFSVSCNMSGGKAVAVYVVVTLVAMFVMPYVARLLL